MIDAALIQRIADSYAHQRHEPSAMAQLRDTFPGVRLTHCNDDELGNAAPVLACSGFNLYLVGGEHCLSLTRSFDSAKGVVIADVDDE